MPSTDHHFFVTKRSDLDPQLGMTFPRAEALDRGVSRDRLAASDLMIPFRGARSRDSAVPTSDDRFLQEHIELVRRCREYAPVAPETWAFSHITAARLYRIPLPPGLRRSPLLHVAVLAGHQPPRRVGVVGHRLTSWRVREVDGLPVVAPEIAWAQVASSLSIDELVVAGDFLVKRKRPLSTIERIGIELAGARGQRGVRTAMAAMRDVRAGTDSPPESELRLVIVRGGLPEPLVRCTVYDPDGFFVGTPDLAYVNERIAIEYEGRGHWEDRDVFEDDIDRRELFRRADWIVFQVTDRRLANPRQLLADLSALLKERSAN